MDQQSQTESSRWHTGRWAVAFVVGLAVALIALAYIVFIQPGETGFLNRTEEGFFEQSTVAFYIVALLICLALVVIKKWQHGLYYSVVLLAMCLRELDFHTRFSKNITSIRFWKAGEIALWHKLIVAVIVIGILFALFIVARRGFRPWLRHLKLGYAYAISLAGAMGYVFMSFALDNQLNMDALDQPVVLFFNLVEESIETGIPILLCVALIQWMIGCANDKNLAPDLSPD